MDSFLVKIADVLLEKFDKQFENICVVLPSQRSKHFLIKAICKKVQKPVFLPEIITIDELAKSLSPYESATNSDLLIELYSIYVGDKSGEKDDFQKFVSWASMFLRDVNDIDMQRKNADDIFSNLKDIKELDVTLFKENEPLGEQSRKRYLEFYCSLGPLYNKLKECLLKKKMAYNGLIYKDLAENIDSYASQMAKKCVFAGFCIFSPAEAAVVSYLLKNKGGEIYFDLDQFYYDSTLPKTLPSYSHNISDLIHLTLSRLELSERDVHFIGNDYRESRKNVTVTGVSKSMEQVLYAVELLKEYENELDRTAVVFADESLVIPFLQTYDCSNANVSVGYPLKGLPCYNLFEIIVQMLRNSQRMTSGNDGQCFYHKDIAAFFSHPQISKRIFTKSFMQVRFLEQIAQRNFILLSVGDIEQIFSDLKGNAETNHIDVDFEQDLQFFFNDIQSRNLKQMEAIVSLFTAISKREEDIQTPSRNIHQKTLRLFTEKLQETNTLLSNFPSDITVTIDIISYFVEELCGMVSLTAKGNRDNGLQVMGLLETRTLDFENVILISANEGTLPNSSTQNSLLLYEIKKFYHLPTFHEKNAVSSYHFFRLLQRAKNVHLIYDADSSDTVNEKSRFVNQLKFQNLKQNTGMKVTEQILTTLPNLDNADNEIRIEKTDEMVDNLTKRVFSPSSLNTYISCSLKFYFQYVAHIRAPQSISEDIDSSVIGTVAHAVFQDFVNDLISCRINNSSNASMLPEKISTLKNNIEEVLVSQYRKALEDKNITAANLDSGKMYLSKVISQKYIEKYLECFDTEFQKVNRFIDTEKEYVADVKIDDEHTVKLKGSIDRIDERLDGTYILDYKTGRVDDANLKGLSLDTVTSDLKQKQPFQLACYAYLYLMNNGDKDLQEMVKNVAAYDENVNGNDTVPDDGKLYTCGIISLRDVAAAKSDYLHSFSIGKRDLLLFAQRLKELLADILNKDIAFVQTIDNESVCTYCDYKDICGKSGKKKSF